MIFISISNSLKNLHQSLFIWLCPPLHGDKPEVLVKRDGVSCLVTRHQPCYGFGLFIICSQSKAFQNSLGFF